MQTVDIDELLQRHKKILDWEFLPPLNEVHQVVQGALQQSQSEDLDAGTVQSTSFNWTSFNLVTSTIPSRS